MKRSTTLFWILYIHIELTIGVSVGSDEPRNLAVNSGERASFSCRSKHPGSRLQWSMRRTGENEERTLTRGEQVLPTFDANYTAEKNDNGELTLIIKNTRLHDAGRYICLELPSSDIASAELIVIENTPACNATHGTRSSILRCDVRYRGNWRPDIDLSIRDWNTASTNVTTEQLTSHLTIPHSKSYTGLYYGCTVKFSQNGTSLKVYKGEITNNGIGTVAINIPEYSKTTVCLKRHIINCGLRMHLTTTLLFVTSIVLASLL